MSQPVSLIQGPGSHSELIHDFLAKNLSTFDSASYWPAFQMIRRKNSQEQVFTSKGYDTLSYFLYGFNQRLALLNQGRQLHKDYLNACYDFLCAHYLHEPKSLIGWTQTSLQTIIKNKKLGGRSVLEHPMAHVDFWMKLNEVFYSDPSIVVKPGYSRFTKRMITRMKQEYRQADYIQVHSSFVKMTFVDAGIEDSKLLTCLLGIDPEVFPNRNVRVAKREKFTLLFVGRLELLKGVHLLLQALEQFDEDEVEVWLVGRVLPEIASFLKKSKKNVMVLGAKNRDELSSLYKAADAMIFPSLCDAFGMVILESMLHGTPVIGSKYSGAPDVIIDKVNGLLIDPHYDIVESIRWAIANREQLSAMGEKAMETVNQNYTSKHYFDHLRRNLTRVGFL